MADLILDLLRSRVDSAKLKHISAAKGGEWCSPCPVCGGNDRFRCWPSQDGGAVAQNAGVPGTWWCRNCDKTGDVISLLMFADGLEFVAACKELRIELSESGRRMRPLRQPTQPSRWTPATWEIPSEQWRGQATKMAVEAHESLMQYPRALEYLAGRGIPLDAVRQYRLGFMKGEDRTGTCLYRARAAFGLQDKQNADGSKTRKVLWIPRGFTIPLWVPSWCEQTEAHRVRIRRMKGDLKEGDSKYLLLTGSGQAPMCLPPENRSPSLTAWVVVEAELDAIAVHHACGRNIGVLATLTNRGKPDAAAHKLLQASPLILVALDFDPPGKKGERPGYKGWEWWRENYPQAKRWPVPDGKDPGHAFELGYDLADWIRIALPGALSFDGKPTSEGSVGVAETGERPMGEGEQAYDQSVQPCESEASAHHHPQSGPRRWQGALPDMPLESVTYPEGFSTTTQYLRSAYAGKVVDDALLIICPKTDPAWYWLYYRYCRKCQGHPKCLVDFLTSPQMLAPLNFSEQSENAHVQSAN